MEILQNQIRLQCRNSPDATILRTTWLNLSQDFPLLTFNISFLKLLYDIIHLTDLIILIDLTALIIIDFTPTDLIIYPEEALRLSDLHSSSGTSWFFRQILRYPGRHVAGLPLGLGGVVSHTVHGEIAAIASPQHLTDLAVEEDAVLDSVPDSVRT